MTADERTVILSEEDLAKTRKFWDDIILKADGTVSMPHVYAELHDFLHMIEEVPAVYSHITCGMMSKPNYYARDVIAQSDQCAENIINDAILAVLDRITDGESVADLVKEFEDD